LRLAAASAALLVATGLLLRFAPRSEDTGDATIRRALRAGKGTVKLPAGTIEILSEIELPPGADDLEIRGAPSGTTLRASDRFRGRAIFRCERANRVRFADFTIDGNRAALERPTGLPGFSTTFARFTGNNGILAIRVASLKIANVRFVNVPGFAVLVSRSHDVLIDGVQIAQSGSRSSSGRNNTTGGILLEEGTRNFALTHCDLRDVRGNGVWTHSLGTAPQNTNGRITANHFARLGRDAIQVGHGAGIRVEENTGTDIGFPLVDVDMEHGATPVAIDTAGDTSHCIYAHNRFTEVNGKCLDLDGFHDGEVRGNSCVNHFGADHYPYGNLGIVFNNSHPAMRPEGVELVENELDGVSFSGMFVIGSYHHIAHNRLRRINLAHCDGKTAKFGCGYAPDQPGLLRSGIYLASRGERPAPTRANAIEDNEISGFGISANCIIAAPGVSLAVNTIARNACKDDAAQ
jgi:hypothetical protein